MPANTIINAVKLVKEDGTTNGTLKLAQCIGRFPAPPAGFALPVTQLFANPSGGKCGGSLNSFYQSITPDGAFVVQCAL
jgi:hypothetical protein